MRRLWRGIASSCSTTMSSSNNIVYRWGRQLGVQIPLVALVKIFFKKMRSQAQQQLSGLSIGHGNIGNSYPASAPPQD